MFLKLKGKDLYKVLDVEEVDRDFTLKRAIEKVLEDKEGNINREKTLFIKDKIDFEYLDLFKTVQAITKELPGLEIYASYTDIDFDPFYYMFYSLYREKRFVLWTLL